MRIREFTAGDLAALERMHAAQGFAYPFPDLANPLFLTRLVVEDDAGRAVMAALLRLTCEAYLLHQPGAGTPRARWRALLALHEAARLDARARGLDDVHAFLPPRVERAFGRRLQRLGWVKDPWASYCRRV
jgi:hypothetical protein